MGRKLVSKISSNSFEFRVREDLYSERFTVRKSVNENMSVFPTFFSHNLGKIQCTCICLIKVC